MKRLNRYLFVISLSALMLVGSGFSIYKHYCGGTLKGVTVNHTAPTCHDKVEATPSCHTTPTMPACHMPAVPADDCCDNQVTWQSTDQYIISAPAALDIEWEMTTILIPVVRLWTTQHEATPLAYLHYHPPLLAGMDQPATLQVFRL